MGPESSLQSVPRWRWAIYLTLFDPFDSLGLYCCLIVGIENRVLKLIPPKMRRERKLAGSRHSADHSFAATAWSTPTHFKFNHPFRWFHLTAAPHKPITLAAFQPACFFHRALRRLGALLLTIGTDRIDVARGL
ncbi:hypothetical protein AVEN_244007-1 [Araneus ventricosus]|uniref:Uncharacterized protein n=1 Tax=Araneus ventricosus TaxID=182803 RepID=A0A4Y2I4S6_ARAVE|nr:hypothetical protein AVEN_244007-1 [Araneus ventricosus]